MNRRRTHHTCPHCQATFGWRKLYEGHVAKCAPPTINTGKSIEFIQKQAYRYQIAKDGLKAQEEASLIYPLRKRFWGWWYAEYWLARGRRVLSVLRYCRGRWDGHWNGVSIGMLQAAGNCSFLSERRERAFASKNRLKAVSQLKLDLFSRKDIYRAIFQPAQQYIGTPMPFLALQCDYYGSGKQSGVW